MITFGKGGKGSSNGMNYKWIGSAHQETPDTIEIQANHVWLTAKEDYLMHLVIKVLVHEPIHHLLWALGVDPHTNYDILRIRFIRMLLKDTPIKERRQLRRSL